MIAAIATVHAANGFFMNWFGQQKGEGFEYHLPAIGLAFTVIVDGVGAVSLDRLISHRLEAKKVERPAFGDDVPARRDAPDCQARLVPLGPILDLQSLH
jgi:hypothetical protein